MSLESKVFTPESEKRKIDSGLMTKDCRLSTNSTLQPAQT